MSRVSVNDIERAVADAFPTEWAEPWDRVGLLAGDPGRDVRGVLVTLDATAAAVHRAAAADANVLVTHHPAFIEPPRSATPGRGAGGTLFSALEAGVALVNAHTNLDRAPAAQHVLPSMLGLEALAPLERSTQPMMLVTVFAPPAERAAVTKAMADAGAGRIGEYEHCSFASEGTGSFTPRSDSDPSIGEPETPTTADENRIEMVCPRHMLKAVVAAAQDAHSYEEPLIVTEEATIARGVARLGMLCAAPEDWTLGRLVTEAGTAFGITPRAWGEPASPLSRVATATGSAGSLVGDALAAGADALVAGEVRYHDALDAVDAGLAIVEVGHDVSEWPLVDVLADAVRRTPGLDAALVKTEAPAPRWWTP